MDIDAVADGVSGTGDSLAVGVPRLERDTEAVALVLDVLEPVPLALKEADAVLLTLAGADADTELVLVAEGGSEVPVDEGVRVAAGVFVWEGEGVGATEHMEVKPASAGAETRNVSLVLRASTGAGGSQTSRSCVTPVMLVLHEQVL